MGMIVRLFQFHFGRLTGLMMDIRPVLNVYFNSTLVRLTALQRKASAFELFHFNSTLVRLTEI